MRFAVLADIHERLRLGADRVTTLSRLKTKNDFLLCYEFFYPDKARLSKHAVTKGLANDVGMFFAVVQDILPDEEPWLALASESNTTTSRALNAEDVLNLDYDVMTFTETASRFDEKEARLAWRWLLKERPVISKRTFFGVLARIEGIQPHILKQNMTRDTIIKVFDAPESIQVLEHWWEHPSMFPAPMRWKPWTKLYPPEEETIAVMIPDGDMLFTWMSNFYTRSGEFSRKPFGQTKPYLCEWAGGNLVDSVRQHEPNAPFSKRMHQFNPESYDLTEHGAWETVMQRLQDEDVSAVRFIKPSQVYTPDGIGGYVMYTNRTHVFLYLRAIDDSRRWTLAALDGLDEHVDVCSLDGSEFDAPKLDDDSYTVVQVAASTVDKDGNINEGHIVSVRQDLGVGDVTQYTDLIERGMEYADR
jgi:hypothetical protein